jgi:hypothetical protein
MLAMHTTLNHPKYIISRLFLLAVPFSNLRFQKDQMKSAGNLNGTFSMTYAFLDLLQLICVLTIAIAWFMTQHFPNPNNMG